MATKALAAVGVIKAPAAGGQAAGWSEMSVPIAVLIIIMALITPIPSVLLDVLLVTDIMMSVVVLMVSMYIMRPVEFSVFPTTLCCSRCSAWPSISRRRA
jgi:flagellar biosynthesis protein FlhA